MDLQQENSFGQNINQNLQNTNQNSNFQDINQNQQNINQNSNFQDINQNQQNTNQNNNFQNINSNQQNINQNNNFQNNMINQQAQIDILKRQIEEMSNQNKGIKENQNNESKKDMIFKILKITGYVFFICVGLVMLYFMFGFVETLQTLG